jgi:peptidoglycan/xylan/chitin deacetylase (PgdA/CDA1 family)
MVFYDFLRRKLVVKMTQDKKYKLRGYFFTSLLNIGFYNIWKRFSKNIIIIVTLHGVMDEEEGNSWKPLRERVSRKTLNKALSLITKYYEFISMDEAVDMLTERIPFRKNCMVLTFDDGYQNNVTHALPILRKYNIPAIIFPSVGHVISGEPFWFDRLDYVVQSSSIDNPEKICLDTECVDIEATDRESLKSSLMQVINIIKSMPGNDYEIMRKIDSELTRIENKSGHRLKDCLQNDYWSKLVSWDELKFAAENGVSIGSHTVDHSRLSLLFDNEVIYQLTESKKLIEKNLSIRCDYICYPNGSFSNTVMSLAKQSGYRAGLTTVEGVNHVGCDVMCLKRFHLPQGKSPIECLAEASGLSNSLSCIKRKLLTVLRIDKTYVGK